MTGWEPRVCWCGACTSRQEILQRLLFRERNVGLIGEVDLHEAPGILGPAATLEQPVGDELLHGLAGLAAGDFPVAGAPGELLKFRGDLPTERCELMPLIEPAPP